MVAAMRADGMVRCTRPELQIVHMDALAGFDLRGCHADDLAELAHGLANGDRLDRQLVTAGNRLRRHDPAEADILARRNIAGCDHQRVGGVEA